MRILFYGDSNTYGYQPGGGRLPKEERYPQIVAQQLGLADIVEAGLNGRNAAFAASGEPELLGGATFRQVMLDAGQVDVVTIMLGTNDLFPPIEADAATIAANMGRMARIAEELNPKVQVILMAPVPISKSGMHFSIYVYGGNKTLLEQDLAQAISNVAKELGVHFFDAGQAVPEADAEDGIHLTAKANQAIGLALAAKLRALGLD